MTAAGQKTGYLTEDFKIFYLTNAEARDFQSHYHDFHKLLYFENGSVSYYVEGETYQLFPGDIVLVPAGEVHRPVIHDTSPYHRLILYISPKFFDHYKAMDIDLSHCFDACSQRHSHVLRLPNIKESRIYPQLRELILTCPGTKKPPQNMQNVQPKQAAHPNAPIYSDDFCTQLSDSSRKLYQTSVLLQFLLLLNHLSDGGSIAFPAASGANTQVLQVLSYINKHLTEELSVDRIADACYLNRSYLMHLFRRETGYTLGSYITEKRLFAARVMIQSGTAVTDACLKSGFSNYTSFYRAYRKKFGEAPKTSRR